MRLRAALLIFAIVLTPLAGHAASAVQHLRYRVVHRYPHQPDAFTEGLFYAHGDLYESTGLNGASEIRRVALKSGDVLQREPLDARYFGEGIVAWGPRLIQLTWRSGTGFIYDLASLHLIGRFQYDGEGWGLTHNQHELIMSNGSATLRRLDPQTLKPIGQIQVSENGHPLPRLNELEWVRGKILANVWQSQRLVIIDPTSGQVRADVDLSALVPPADSLPAPTDDVLNGIAYDAADDRLFVTGKCWPWLYEIKLQPASAAP